MPAKPKTDEGKQLVNEASQKYHDNIDWNGLVGTPVAGDADQEMATISLIEQHDYAE